jgi:hypothetical protein
MLAKISVDERSSRKSSVQIPNFRFGPADGKAGLRMLLKKS